MKEKGRERERENTMAYNKRSSGLDFSDRGSTLDQHPDLVLNSGAPSLQRNKTERTRLQGLMRIPTRARASRDPSSMTWKERFNIWMINEGGRRIFFYVIILLHILVFVFGIFFVFVIVFGCGRVRT